MTARATGGMACLACAHPLAAGDAYCAACGQAVRACRNCGHALAAGDAYCGHCGQETQVALPTARQFMREAAGRYVALDGRLWRTLGALATRPGFLTGEYFAGRRRRYIRPGRLFLVTSLVAFAAIRLSIGAPSELLVRVDPDIGVGASPTPAAPGGPAGNPPTTAAGAAAAAGSPSPGTPAPKAGASKARGAKPAAAELDGTLVDTEDFNFSFDRNLNFRITRDQRNRVPAALRERIDHFNAMSRADKIDQIVGNTLRYGPYAAFALLPAFALLLAFAYPFSSRRYPQRPRRFAGHLVFAAHSHAFLFAFTTLMVLLPMPGWLTALLIAAACTYLLMALRAVYGGGWILTVLRAFALLIAYLVMFALATLALLLAALLVR